MVLTRYLSIAFTLLSISIFGASCAGCKHANSVSTSPSAKDLLVGKTWQSQKVLELITGTPVDITDASGIGYFRLNSDGSLLSSMMNGTWQLSTDESTITFIDGSHKITASILELSAASLRLKISLPQNIPPTMLDITLIPGSTSNTTDPEANFEDLWKQFDQRYSFFEIKHLNWDSIHAVYRPMVHASTTAPELFSILSSMLSTLKDGHVSLATPYGNFGYYEWYTRYPRNCIEAAYVASYLSHNFGTICDGLIWYGKIQNDVGYINIGSNFNGNPNTWSAAIDAIIDSLKNTRGIIVDLRQNTGGNDALGNIVAGRFADKERIYSYIRWRNGPHHSDFTDFQPSTIAPQGKRQFLKPVAVLTNRRCFSSAEGTILMFRALPNVTTIGDTTGGGSANPLMLMLPNGWSYRVSRWIQYTAGKAVFETKGLPPDIPVWISDSETAAHRDAILEKAITYLKSK